MPDDFDLSVASKGAFDALSNPTPPEAPAPVPPADPATPPPSPEAPVTPAPVVATKTYKVKVDGQEVEVPEDELLNGYSRTAKFTKSMMELAEQRKTFETERQQAAEREKAINEFFRDPQNIVRYYESVTGQKLTPAQATAVVAANTPAPPTPGSDEFATISTVQQLAAKEAAEKAATLQQQVATELQRTVQETQKWTATQIQKAQIEADQQRKAVEYHGEINTTVSSLLEQFPVLKAVDDIENILCHDAQRMDPTSLAEAKAALLNVAKARSEKLEAQFTERLKASAVQQTKLQTQGTEPPGGTAPQAAPTAFKLGDAGLSAAALDYMNKAAKK